MNDKVIGIVDEPIGSAKSDALKIGLYAKDKVDLKNLFFKLLVFLIKITRYFHD